MAFLVAALEVSDKIQTVGAFAGFAAIIGLAVMSVLYFGQAREVKRLREWAGRAPERAAEMQDRVTTGAQRRVVAEPVRTPAQPTAATPARPLAAQPATPGAAAAAAPSPGATPATATPAADAAKPATAGDTPDEPAEGTDQPTVLQPAVAGAGAGAGPAAPAASTAHPAEVPHAPAATPAPNPSTTANAAGASAPPPAQPLRSGRSVREAMDPPASSSASGGTTQSPAGATLAIVAAVAAILLAIVLVATGVIGGGGGSASSTNQIVPTTPQASTGGTSPTAKPVERGGVSLVVLNGTGTPNLARNAADALIKDGYTTTGAGNRGDSTIPQTRVLYAAGGQRAARDVARLLDLGSGAIGKLDTGTEVVAKGFAANDTTPQVVVVLGADKAP